MNRNQKGNTMVAVIIVVIVAIILVVYFLNKGGTVPYLPTSQTIQNDTDLTNASKDLDNVDLNSMDSELNQNTTDSSSF